MTKLSVAAAAVACSAAWPACQSTRMYKRERIVT